MISPGGLDGNQNLIFKKKYNRKVIFKRMMKLEDLLGPIVFLSSDMSKYVTGQNIFVDGGFLYEKQSSNNWLWFLWSKIL